MVTATKISAAQLDAVWPRRVAMRWKHLILQKKFSTRHLLRYFPVLLHVAIVHAF